jgi:hypothetical protein
MEECGTTHILHRAESPTAEKSCGEEDLGLPSPKSMKEQGARFLAENTQEHISRAEQVREDLSLLGLPWLRPIVKRWHDLCNRLEVQRVPDRRGRVSRFVQSYFFECLGSAVILTNCVFVVIKTDFDIENLDSEIPNRNFHFLWTAPIEMCFVFWYCVELTLRLMAHRWFFFCGKDKGWNLFDTIVVGVSVIEVMSTVASNKSFLRVVRIFKIARVLRLARSLRSFVAPMRLMLDMLTVSFFALLRCIMILAFITSIFAILFTQEVTMHLAELSPDARRDSQAEKVTRYFGSVWTSALSLFMAVSNGDAWVKQYTVLQEVDSTIATAMYLFFILFFVVAFWNIVMGQFMFETLKAAAPDIDELVFQRRKQDLDDAKALLQVIRHVKQDQKCYVGMEEIVQLMRNKQVRGYFEVRGIDIQDTQLFFDMFTCGRQQKVDLSLFVCACLRMKGVAASLDLHSMDFELRLMHQDQLALWRRGLEVLERIDARQLDRQSDDPTI